MDAYANIVGMTVLTGLAIAILAGVAFGLTALAKVTFNFLFSRW